MVRRLNRYAMLGILPLMALAILAAAKAGGRTEAITLPTEGTLIVANLRAETLTIAEIGDIARTQRTLALAGPPHEMVEAGGRVYVSLGRANAVVEVEPGAPGVLRTLAIGGQPHGLAAHGDELLVTLDGEGRLVRVDRALLAETSREPAGDTPHAVAAADGAAFVVASRENRVLRLGPGAAVGPTGTLPESVAVAGRFVVTADAGGTLSLFDHTLAQAGEIRLKGGPVRVQPIGGETVAVALNEAGELAIVDLAERKVVKRLRAAGRPDGLCLSPAGDYLAVVSNATDRVKVYRTRDWRSIGIVETGDGPGSCLWTR